MESCQLRDGLIAKAETGTGTEVDLDPTRWDTALLLRISIVAPSGKVLSSVTIETDGMLWGLEVLPTPDREAFLVLTRGHYDEWYEWWCLAYEVDADGSLREIHRESRAAHCNCVTTSASWIDDRVGIVKWLDARGSAATPIVRQQSHDGGAVVVDIPSAYQLECERRTLQFKHYLELMRSRRAKIGNSCFIVFAQSPREEEGVTEQNRRNQEKAARYRYIQCGFDSEDFRIDLSRDTLDRSEAETILRNRQGFFYVHDRAERPFHKEDAKKRDPFQKVYRYDDEQTAAEDIAYILFEVWKLPVRADVYVTAAAFSGEKDWEIEFPIS